jgi:hypothetical protein
VPDDGAVDGPHGVSVAPAAAAVRQHAGPTLHGTTLVRSCIGMPCQPESLSCPRHSCVNTPTPTPHRFIKVGQLCSTRSDLFPAEFVEELGKLQDRVPAFSADKAAAIVEADLGQPVSKLFRSFDARPIAAASLGQVRGWHHRYFPRSVLTLCLCMEEQMTANINTLADLEGQAWARWCSGNKSIIPPVEWCLLLSFDLTVGVTQGL